LRAVILAGGRGTRLAPYTTVFPKPLMPIGEIPIIEIVIRQLRHFGFRRVTLAVGHLGELIRAYIENNASRFEGMSIDYVHEQQPTGTAGSLTTIPDLNDTFLAMNGDVLTTLDYGRLLAHHRAAGAALTIATFHKKVKIDLGVIETGNDGYVSAYREKPELEYAVSMGIYLYEPRALQGVQRGGYLDFPDLVQRLLGSGEKVATFPWDGYWLDIGRPDDFQAASAEFLAHRSEWNID
jgi:NDP-sugar pyrophosphorylase family protein